MPIASTEEEVVSISFKKLFISLSRGVPSPAELGYAITLAKASRSVESLSGPFFFVLYFNASVFFFGVLLVGVLLCDLVTLLNSFGSTGPFLVTSFLGCSFAFVNRRGT